MPLPRARTSALCACAVAGLVATSCSGSSAGSLAGKTPAQIVSTGLAAARAQASVHYVLEASGQSQRQTITGDAGRSDGVQTVATGSDQVEVELIGGVAYLKGNAGGLEHTIGLPAAVASGYAGRWIAVSQSDTLYRPITEAVTIDGIFRQLEPTSPLQASSPGRVSGHEVIGVRGGLPGTSQKGITGDAVLYVSTASPSLPLGFSGQASSNGKSVTEIGAFSHWGEALHVAAPAGAVPFASLPKS